MVARTFSTKTKENGYEQPKSKHKQIHPRNKSHEILLATTSTRLYRVPRQSRKEPDIQMGKTQGR